MKIAFLTLGAMLLACSYFSQRSIHQEQLEYYNSLGNSDATYYEKTVSAAPKPSRPKASCNLDQVVYGWHPYWVGSAYQNYDFDLLSHFSFFSYEVNASTGNANSTHGWATSSAVDAALASGTKVTLCVTLFSGHNTFFGSSTAQQTLITNLINLVSSRGAHGVQIDFEGLPNAHKTNFANWMVSLSTQMKAAIPGAEISTVLYAVDWNDVFDFSIMNAHVDHYIVMGYAYYYQGSSNTGPCDPLYHFGSSYNYTLSRTTSYYIDKGCPRDKLVMGLPYYGYEWPTSSTTVPSPTTGSGSARTYAVVKNNSSGNYSLANHQWDADSYTDIYVFNSGGTKQTFIALDSAIEKRFDHIRKSGIAGMGIWALGYDDGYNEIWNLIDNYMTECYSDPCSGTIHDFGGPTKDYYDDEDYTWTVSPDGATSLDINFSMFDVEANYDYLYIYDGNSTSAAQIAGSPFTGTSSPGSFTTSTGAVTFRFTSDGATNTPGFLATYSCNQDNTPPTTSINSPSSWQTADFNTGFTDDDGTNGTGIKTSFWNVSDDNGSEFRSNETHGFLNDNFIGLHSDWTSNSGTWNVTSGELNQTDEANSNTNFSIDLTQDAANSYLYHWTGQINGSGSNRRAGLHFFCDDASLSNRGNSYLVYWRTDNDKCQIYKVTNDAISIMTDDPITVDANITYDFKIYFNQSTGEIKAFLDNQIVSSWTDSSPHNAGNSISLRSGNANYIVDDLAVYRSRGNNEIVTLGTSSDMIRYQNQNPTSPSASIKSVCLDNANNFSSISSDLVDVDWTAPETGSSEINDGLSTDIDTFYVNTEISANWSGIFDSHSGIASYQYSVGTSPGLTDIIPLTSNGTATSFTESGLSLNYGIDYFINVMAVNNAGLQSATVSSNGQHLKLPVQTPNAGFAPSSNVLCAGDSIQLINSSTNATGFVWTINSGSATLSSNTDSNPYLIVSNSGQVNITLDATGPGGTDSDNQSINFSIVSAPVASMVPSSSTVNLPLATVTFTNTSTNANSYFWDFGDGATSTDINPFHNYNAVGNYTVTLIAENGICNADTTSINIEVQAPVGIEDEDAVDIRIYPNPFNAVLNVTGLGNIFNYSIRDISGRLIKSGSSNGTIQLNEALSAGSYFISLTGIDGIRLERKLIKN